MGRLVRAAGMLWLWIGLCAVPLQRADAQFALPDSLAQSARKKLLDDFEMQTLGGRQFWGDVQFFHGWRIQRNVFTGHHRLLDEHDWRHASGTLEECQKKLADIRVERNLPPMSGRGVILLHGIVRSSKSIYTAADELRKAGFSTFPMEYPSTQITIPEAADLLNSVISQLDGIEELSLVGHSMGGLVIRAWFDRYADPRIHRVVMMGTPNRGAEMADLLQRNLLFRLVFGPAGQQLITKETGLIPTLPPPACEFAVIAGGRGDGTGWNPLIPGDDDGTVAVRSVRLSGACDSIVVPCLHHALLGSRDVSRLIVQFLNTGRLREAGDPEPVVDPDPAGTATSEAGRADGASEPAGKATLDP